jgi:hypothetical protein
MIRSHPGEGAKDWKEAKGVAKAEEVHRSLTRNIKIISNFLLTLM